MAEILGVDLSIVPNLALEIEEAVGLSSMPSKSWIDTFRAELQSAGISEVVISEVQFVVEIAPPSWEVEHLAQVKRTIPVIGKPASPHGPLMPLIRKAADTANLVAGSPYIEVWDAELGPSKKVSLLMDVPVEVSVATVNDFKQWSAMMSPLIKGSGLAADVETTIATTPEATRFYLVLKQVRHEYAEGRAIRDHAYLAHLRQLARQVNEEKR